MKSRRGRSLTPYQPYFGAPGQFFGPYYPPLNKPYHPRPYPGENSGRLFPHGRGSAYHYKPLKGVPTSSKNVGKAKPLAYSSSSVNFPPGHTFMVTATRTELPNHVPDAEPTSFTVLEQLAPAPPQFQQIEITEAQVVPPYTDYHPRYRWRY